jgi:ATP-dependent DNA helicase RecG
MGCILSGGHIVIEISLPVIMDRLVAIIDTIKKSFTFAAKNNFNKLAATKGLQSSTTNLAREALTFPLKEPLALVFQRLLTDFEQFDALALPLKKKNITEGLTLLTRAEELLKSHAFATSPDSALSASTKRLSTSMQYIKGVGPKLSQVLAKKGIATVGDALYFVPRKYEDRRTIKKIAEITSQTTETIRGHVLMTGVVPYGRGRKRVFEVAVTDGTGTIIAKWFHFNAGYMKKRFKKGQEILLSGEVKRYNFQKEVHHPDIELIEPGEEESWEFRSIIPVYSETEGLYQKTVRRIMKRVVDEHAGDAIDGIAVPIRKRQHLLGLKEALRRVHFPDEKDSLNALQAGSSSAHHRLIFDEFFFLELGLALRKRGVSLENGNSFVITDFYNDKIKSILPFKLTASQERALAEIMGDLKKAHPMNRLLQGDVGSGKTIVALIASLVVIENGYQVAFMAPTEILAEQHYSTVVPFAEQLGVRVVLLTSSVKNSKKISVSKEIADGKVDITIGTHAIIQESVHFSKLGLAIIDEQHRFGVMQRAKLKKKGVTPDVLVMTATPIPRTLGLTVYGDLDSSIIDQLPPGRVPVKTKLYHERNREVVYKKIAKEVENKKQVFIVYPLIEESEKLDLMNATHMAKHLREDVFPQYTIGVLHGRIDSREKEQIMSDFQSKKIDILVATTVVEVGIDVPNASLMVIEHAERFGLSQLHQLRGRVGRSDYPSQCILLAQYSASDDARRRLRVMEETTDGFKIAEEDFAIRGPGEFLGTRQSGIPDFRIANILKDVKILSEARKEAFRLIEEDPALSLPEHRATQLVLRERWKGRLELASIG